MLSISWPPWVLFVLFKYFFQASILLRLNGISFVYVSRTTCGVCVNCLTMCVMFFTFAATCILWWGIIKWVESNTCWCITCIKHTCMEKVIVQFHWYQLWNWEILSGDCLTWCSRLGLRFRFNRFYFIFCI
jgi:hypothetical protein